MLNYYLLGVLELRFRGGELCRGRGDGEHDSILNRVCVYEERDFNHADLFFLVRFKAAFSEGKIRLGFQKYRKIVIY
jgi:hypothetical protein